MTKPRKTFAVKDMQLLINNILRDSPDASKGRREGMLIILEDMLHKTGNYKGFSYLESAKVDPITGDINDSTRVVYH